MYPFYLKAWDTHDSIIVEGYLLTSTCGLLGVGDARYRTAFSRDFPHFEVMTLDPSPKKSLAIGVAFKNYSGDIRQGKRERIVYWTVRGIISAKGTDKCTTGYHKAGQGDVIRCTILFEEKQERDGEQQVPVVFTINGTKIIPEGDPPLMEYCPDRPLYPYISFGYDTSVLAKMVMKEEVNHQDLQRQEKKSDLTKTLSELSEAKTELKLVKTELTEIKSKLVQANKSLEKNLETKLAKVKESLETKLDAVLAKLSEK